jgi:hypothetical protein
VPLETFKDARTKDWQDKVDLSRQVFVSRILCSSNLSLYECKVLNLSANTYLQLVNNVFFSISHLSLPFTGRRPKRRLQAENRKSATGSYLQTRFLNACMSKFTGCLIYSRVQVVFDYEAEMEDLKESMNEFFSSEVCCPPHLFPWSSES